MSRLITHKLYNGDRLAKRVCVLTKLFYSSLEIPLKWKVRMLRGFKVCVSVLNDLLRMHYTSSLSLSVCPLSYCITMESSSSLSSSCRVGAGARRLPLLLQRSVSWGREAFAGGGPRDEEEEGCEEDEGRGATVALTLLFIPSWRPWFCGWVETTHRLYYTSFEKHSFNAA